MSFIATSSLILRILLLGYERIAFKEAGRDEDSIVAAFLLFAIATIFLLPILLFVDIKILVFPFAFISASLYSITFILYVYSLSNYDISLVTPLYNFNIFFLLFLSVIAFDESFTPFKIIGISLLLYGTTYLEKKDQNILDSIKAIIHNKGCQSMIAASLLMAFGRIIDRYMITEFDPALYSIAIYFAISVYLGAVILLQRKISLIKAIFSKKNKMKAFMGGSFANAYAYVFLLIAFISIEVSVAESLSMLSVLVSIALSWLFFKEDIKNRLIGAFIMFLGTLLLFFGL